MGVFSYLSIKKPASLLWKAFSPSRDVGEVEGATSQCGVSSAGEGHLRSLYWILEFTTLMVNHIYKKNIKSGIFKNLSQRKQDFL